jgi:hypothetical protein
LALKGWFGPYSAGVSPRLLSAVIQLTLGFFLIFLMAMNLEDLNRVKKPDELLNVPAAGGSRYHFFCELAARVVIERPA